MTLKEIREAYEKNYQEILTVILQMGGEGNIPHHKAKNTPLCQKLRQLQRTEHWLLSAFIWHKDSLVRRERRFFVGH